MAGMFSNNRAVMTDRQLYITRYNTARLNVLLLIILSVVNLILLAVGGNSYFLFSAYVPYQLAAFGYVLCGMMPDEFYAEGFEGITFLDPSVFYVLLVIAFMILAVYALLWFLSRKERGGFLVAVVVLISVDTVAMLLGGISADMAIDLLLHAFVIYEMVLGIMAWRKLKAMPEEPAAVAVEAGENTVEEESTQEE